MLLFFLLLILATAIIANVQLHKWKRQRRMDVRAAVKSRKKPTPQKNTSEEVDLDEIDWDGLASDELDVAPPPPTPVARPRPAPVKAEPPAPPSPTKPTAAPGGDFLPLERALQERMSTTQRSEALAHLLKANLHVPAPDAGEQHVVLDMDDGSYVPVATHPAAAVIALGHLAENLQPRQGAQLLRELRGKELGLLVVARNPQKPSMARLWKILPEDL
ncbi:hypothetical protein JVX91_10575 [Pseudomonas sp. PDNC002]|uniref:hypothetical protein n=1 Tax=Pseudomonas sp. PDNC002 TaxID=2811422 RepID=UPI00196293D6|nr:hypothetical protein [Pseudomonas sp. PDNC002]QRY81514.1 hypothetical protein JVX91_10575 [Pseudomonas sp. PDNC002]